MKNPEFQDQHKIPQVYLKQFGYEKNGHWKISVLQVGEEFTRQKSIGSFSAETNVFDIESDDERIHRLFEEINCDIENEYPDLLQDLDVNQFLSEKSYAVLLQLIPNFICRSDYWRDWVLGLLQHENRENFVKVICAHRLKSIDNFESIEEENYYRLMIDSPPEKAVNRALLFFTEHLLRRIGHYKIVIIKSRDDKPWFTTDNPVVLDNRTARHEIMTNDSELYFSLSPKYLVYLNHVDSKDKANELRGYETNKVHLATDEQNWVLQNKIMFNAVQFVLIAGESKYRKEENALQ
ncbi:MAG: hypothetical protein COA57_13735 [Flavobacteriales bacterium]|nr:MAG: hypothetical protein COA57_13735 [Flavobacteriales bacterium]